MPFVPLIGLSILIHLVVILKNKISIVSLRNPDVNFILDYFVTKKEPEVIKQKRGKSKKHKLVLKKESKIKIFLEDTRLFEFVIMFVAFICVLATATILVFAGIDSKFSSLYFIKNHIYILSDVFSKMKFAKGKTVNYFLITKLL